MFFFCMLNQIALHIPIKQLVAGSSKISKTNGLPIYTKSIGQFPSTFALPNMTSTYIAPSKFINERAFSKPQNCFRNYSEFMNLKCEDSHNPPPKMCTRLQSKKWVGTLRVNPKN
ncbi:hypothetical protein ACE6H2_026436 [Prunus campanulata]